MENGNNVPMIFENESLKMGIKVAMYKGEIYAVGSHLASTLGYINTKQAISDNVDEQCKVTVSDLKNQVAQSKGISQIPLVDPLEFDNLLNNLGLNSKSISVGQTVLIDEVGIYQLALKSKLPSAISFQKWVCSDVLPAIRKHGMYLVGQENKSDEEILLIKSELAKATQRIEIMAAPRYLPMAFLEQVYGSDYYIGAKKNKCYTAGEIFRFLTYIGLACNQHQNKGKKLTKVGKIVLKDCVTEISSGTHSGVLQYGLSILDVVPEVKEFMDALMYGDKRDILDIFARVKDIRRSYRQRCMS